VEIKKRREANIWHRTIAYPLALFVKAGQFIEMTLLDPPETDAEGNTRAFSMASAPDDETLMGATRMRDTAFKRVLNIAS
jgi:ferredoxin-NADP reductase